MLERRAEILLLGLVSSRRTIGSFLSEADFVVIENTMLTWGVIASIVARRAKLVSKRGTMIFRALALCGCLAIVGCDSSERERELQRSSIAYGSGYGSGMADAPGSGSDGPGSGSDGPGSGSDGPGSGSDGPGSGSDGGPGDGGSGGDGGTGDPPEPPIATECPVTEETQAGAGIGRDALAALMSTPTTPTNTGIVGFPAGCCDTNPATAGAGFCWANSPVGQCGTNGQNNGLPPVMGSCRGLWTFPPTFDSALKYCMCMTMPNGACYNNVRGCLACMNGTHNGGSNPAPPYHPGTGFPAGGCFVIPVAELYCYNNVGCTAGQQAALGASVACQLPVCTAWATCKAAGTC